MKTDSKDIKLAMRAVFENGKDKSPEAVKTEMAERYMLELAEAAKAGGTVTKASGKKVETQVDALYDRFIKEDEVIKYLSNGHDVKEAASSFGISPAAVYTIIKTAREFGVSLPRIDSNGRTKGRGIAAFKVEIETKIREGVSNQAIAQEYGVKIGNVSQFRQKLFKTDLRVKGFSEIKTGRGTMTQEEKSAALARRNEAVKEKKRTIQEFIADRATVGEEVEGWCCSLINDGADFGLIIDKAEKLGGMFAATVTTGYLEQLKYGALLSTILDQYNSPEIEYSFDGIELAYEYFDASMPRPVVRSRIVTREIARLFFNDNKEFKTIIDESTLSCINHFLRTGEVESIGKNTTLRIIGLPEEQQKLLYNIAFN